MNPHPWTGRAELDAKTGLCGCRRTTHSHCLCAASVRHDSGAKAQQITWACSGSQDATLPPPPPDHPEVPHSCRLPQQISSRLMPGSLRGERWLSCISEAFCGPLPRAHGGSRFPRGWVLPWPVWAIASSCSETVPSPVRLQGPTFRGRLSPPAFLISSSGLRLSVPY